MAICLAAYQEDRDGVSKTGGENGAGMMSGDLRYLRGKKGSAVIDEALQRKKTQEAVQ